MTDLATMRTDVIGSLLRPERLKQARHRFDAGEADAAELRAVEDACIREAVALQEDAGLEAMRQRGEDPDVNLERSIAADNRILEAFGDAVSGIHLCRGNQRSMWHREGACDAVAERLFGSLKHRRLLLEYDSERAGGFEPLRFVRKDTVVVLGLVSTKVPEMESVDDLKRRIDDAARFLPLEQLAISPQCGFSSDVVGNLITPDDQKRKLERVVETARQVWG